MSNKDKYEKVFFDNFPVDKAKLTNLKYNDISEWDSIGHMTLIGELESTFNIATGF